MWTSVAAPDFGKMQGHCQTAEFSGLDTNTIPRSRSRPAMKILPTALRAPITLNHLLQARCRSPVAAAARQEKEGAGRSGPRRSARKALR
jgi:hypothetical protein